MDYAEQRQAAWEAHLSRCHNEAQLDIDAFAEMMRDFLPPGFATRADVRNPAKNWARPERRDETLPCVRAMQALYVAACKGEPQTIAEKAIGSHIVKIIEQGAEDSFCFEQ